MHFSVTDVGQRERPAVIAARRKRGVTIPQPYAANGGEKAIVDREVEKLREEQRRLNAVRVLELVKESEG